MANQKFPFKTMKPGEQHRVKVEPERYAHAMTAAASARYYWAKHYKVKLDVQLDTKASEVVYTVRKNPLLAMAKQVAKAAEDKNLTSEAVAAPKVATWSVSAPHAFDALSPMDKHVRLFFRDAFVSCLTMNEPEKAQALATEATNFYRATLTTLGKENRNGAHA